MINPFLGVVGWNREFPPASVEQNVPFLFLRGALKTKHAITQNGCYVDEKALVLVTSNGVFHVVRHEACKELRAKSFRGVKKASLERRLNGLRRAEA